MDWAALATAPGQADNSWGKRHFHLLEKHCHLPEEVVAKPGTNDLRIRTEKSILLLVVMI